MSKINNASIHFKLKSRLNFKINLLSFLNYYKHLECQVGYSEAEYQNINI